MVRYLFRISYIGTKYRGSQRCLITPKETVQGAIETGLSSLKCSNVPVTSFASRTDKGVHAIDNAFHADIEHEKQGEVYQPNFLKKALNSYLRDNGHEILVTNVCVVPDTFHARFHVKWRCYLYRLAILKPELGIEYPEKSYEEYLPVSLLNRCHVVRSDLNIGAVRDVLNMFCGQHNFSAFTKCTLRYPWRDYIRSIDEIKFYELPFTPSFDDPQYLNIDMWEFYVKSSSFLYHQVRKLVGTAIAVGYGTMSKSYVDSVLTNPQLEEFCKIPIAPARGLYLRHLHYHSAGFIGNESPSIYKESSDVT